MELQFFKFVITQNVCLLNRISKIFELNQKKKKKDYLSHSTVKIHIHSNSDTLYADGLLEIREHGFIF